MATVVVTVSILSDCPVCVKSTSGPAESGFQNIPSSPDFLYNLPWPLDGFEGAVISDNWKYPYSREKAAYPLPFTREGKFWPSVRRVDNAYGDRNLVCSCLPVEEYIEERS